MLLSGHQEHTHPCFTPGLGSAKAKPKSSSLPGCVQHSSKTAMGHGASPLLGLSCPWCRQRMGKVAGVPTPVLCLPSTPRL